MELEQPTSGGVARVNIARPDPATAASRRCVGPVAPRSNPRPLCVALGVALACTLFPSAAYAATAAPPAAPVLHARSAAVLDMRDGRVLWSENGRLRLPMASTTKLMTALVSLQLEHDQMNTPMTVPPQVKQAYGELLYLRPGDQYTYLQLFEGMLLPSANDAAIAIAVDSAGSLSRFVSLMNQAASAYGLTDTHYVNPDGLDAPDHYTSADDLARLGWVAMNNKIIRSIVNLTSATIPWPRHGSRLIGNINALLTQYPGADGVKTGYTSEALNVIVGSAHRNGQSVIAVLMGEPASTFWTDEEHLLDYGIALEAARGAVPTVPPPAAPQGAVVPTGQQSLTAVPAPFATGTAGESSPPAPSAGASGIPGLITATLVPAEGPPLRPAAAGSPVAPSSDQAAVRRRPFGGPARLPLAGAALLAVIGFIGWGQRSRRRRLRLAGITGFRLRRRRGRTF